MGLEIREEVETEPVLYGKGWRYRTCIYIKVQHTDSNAVEARGMVPQAEMVGRGLKLMPVAHQLTSRPCCTADPLGTLLSTSFNSLV